jgi:hypothetical protein
MARFNDIASASFLSLLLVGLIVVAFVLGPLLTLWALNTLSEEAKFGWYIPHSFWTYVSVWALMIAWRTPSSSSKSK